MEVRKDKLRIYEKMTFNVPFMAELADKVTVPCKSTAYSFRHVQTGCIEKHLATGSCLSLSVSGNTCAVKYIFIDSKYL